MSLEKLIPVRNIDDFAASFYGAGAGKLNLIFLFILRAINLQHGHSHVVLVNISRSFSSFFIRFYFCIFPSLCLFSSHDARGEMQLHIFIFIMHKEKRSIKNGGKIYKMREFPVVKFPFIPLKNHRFQSVINI
jgi:hypothetical protein